MLISSCFLALRLSFSHCWHHLWEYIQDVFHFPLILQATKSWVGAKLVFNIWALRWQLVVHCSNISHNMYLAWNYTAFHLNLHFCFHYIVCCYHESEDILCFSCSILTLPMAENSAWWGNWKNRNHIAWVKTRGGRACREIDYKHVVEIYKSLCNTYV